MNTTFEIGQIIHDNLVWLDPKIVKVADESLHLYTVESYDASISRAGSAIELLCSQIVEKLGGTPPLQRTIGAFYSRQENTPKGTKGPLQNCLSSFDGIDESEIEALVERLRQAAQIRNKGAHGDIPDLLTPTSGDASQILNILGLLVSWCNSRLIKDKSLSPVNWKAKIFISVGTPHRLDQRQFIEKLRDMLTRHAIQLINLSSADYSDEKPFDQIKILLKGCDGALIVGWERYHAYTIFERERSKRERIYQDTMLPTAWNHIEGSMAAMLDLPVLILREKNLHAEGIFEASNHGHRIINFDLAEESTQISQRLSKTLLGWVDQNQRQQHGSIDH